MTTIIDLESPSTSPSPSPRLSKKRSHDGTLIGDQENHQLSSEDRNQSITENLSEENVGADNKPEADSQHSMLDIGDILCDSLENIGNRSIGTFATNKVLTITANPGLYVKDLGGIGLPLSEHDAHRLIASFNQTCSRIDPEISQDKDACGLGPRDRIIEWDSSCFELRNPAWHQELVKTLISAVTDLGITDDAASVRAELCKLVLHEEGANYEQYSK